MQNSNKIYYYTEILPENSLLTDLVNKWSDLDYLSDVENITEKKQLAVLLENCSRYNHCTQPTLSSNQSLWLTKQIWLRCKFKKLVSVQPATSPAMLVYYYKTTNTNNLMIESEAVAAKTSAYIFDLFPNADFEKVKEVYADAMAEGIDYYIVKSLFETNSLLVENVVDCVLSNTDCDLKSMFDYLIAPYETINFLSQKSSSKGIELFGIETVADEKTLVPLAVGGKYPCGIFNTPIFCPYVLFQEGPKKINLGISQPLLMRLGWFNGSKS